MLNLNYKKIHNIVKYGVYDHRWPLNNQ